MQSWDDVRYFLALAEARSLAGAGRALGVRHTTVARRVSQLEEDLGVTLITRSTDGVQLTPAGERALEHARAAGGAMDALELSVRDDDERVEGTVRVTVSEAFSGYLARRLAVLRQTYPNLDIHLLTGNRTFDLSRGEADFAVRHAPTEDGTLKIRKLADLAWSVYACRSYLADRPRPQTVEELRSHPVIGYDDSMSRTDGAVWLRNNDFDDRVVMRVNSIPAAVNACLGGLGVVPLPCFLALDEPQLVRLLDDAISVRDSYLVMHPDAARPRRVRVVIDHILALVEQDRAAIEG